VHLVGVRDVKVVDAVVVGRRDDLLGHVRVVIGENLGRA
jgi:hypothetical protein